MRIPGLDIPCRGFIAGSPIDGQDYDCDYEQSGGFGCDDCVCNHGYYNPKTGKKINWFLRVIQRRRNMEYDQRCEKEIEKFPKGFFVQPDALREELSDDREAADAFEEFDMFDSEKKTQAETLPEGWIWTDYGDGSGGIKSPDGESYFSYDLQTGEYIKKDGRWEFLPDYPYSCMGLKEFHDFAEEYIRKNILKTEEKK